MHNTHFVVTVAIALLICGCKPDHASKSKNVEALKEGSAQSIMRKQICDNNVYELNDKEVESAKSRVGIDGFNQNSGALTAAKDGFVSALRSIPAALNTMFIESRLHVVEMYKEELCAPPTSTPNKSDTNKDQNPPKSVVMCFGITPSQPTKSGAVAVPDIYLFANGAASDDQGIKQLVHSLLTVELVVLYDEWYTPMSKTMKAPPNVPKGDEIVKATQEGIAKYESFRAKLAKQFVDEVKAGADKEIGESDPGKKAAATDHKNTLIAMRKSLEENFVGKFDTLPENPLFQRFILSETVDSESCSKATKEDYQKLLPATHDLYNKKDEGNPFLLVK